MGEATDGLGSARPWLEQIVFRQEPDLFRPEPKLHPIVHQRSTARLLHRARLEIEQERWLTPDERFL